MEPAITPEEIPDYLFRVVKGIKEGREKLCKIGVDTQCPDEITFVMNVAYGRNAVARTVVTDPSTDITNQEQTTDSVTTHGRTNEEDRLNRGDKVTVTTSTQEDSA